MTIIAIILLAYLFVAPDKGTLAATRGTEGAFRAVLGMPPRQRRAAKGSSSKASSGSKKAAGPKGSRSFLDGWREGVASARVAREEGRDVWARTSRGAGKVAGGTRNVVGGIRTTVRTRRDRKDITTAPDTQTTVVDPTTDPATGNDHQVDVVVDVRPVDVVNETDDAPQQDGTLLFSSKNDDLGAAIGESAHPDSMAGELDELVDGQVPDGAPVTPDEVAEEPPADDRYFIWTNPDSGQRFVLDRLNLDEPQACLDERDAGLWAGFYNDRHGLATQNGEPPTALSNVPPTGGDSSDSYSGGDFDRNGKPWALVITGPQTTTCPKCGGQTVRIDDSFDADEATSTWSNAYRCPTCSDHARFHADLKPSEHQELFPRLSPSEEAAVNDLAGRLAPLIFPTPAAAPAAANTTSNTNPGTTDWKEATPMSIAGTDLANLDEVDGEAKAALNAIEALTEALSEIKGWGGNLPDRWSGTSWGTDGLDSAIAGVAEAASELQIPEALLEHLAAIGQEIAKARTVGEAAAEVRAKGDLAAFGAN